MDLSTLYTALVFLAPVALGLTLLGAMVFDQDWSGRVAAKPKTTSTAKRNVIINAGKDDIGCYA